jgi:hypothetical protein
VAFPVQFLSDSYSLTKFVDLLTIVFPAASKQETPLFPPGRVIIQGMAQYKFDPATTAKMANLDGKHIRALFPKPPRPAPQTVLDEGGLLPTDYAVLYELLPAAAPTSDLIGRRLPGYKPLRQRTWKALLNTLEQCSWLSNYAALHMAVFKRVHEIQKRNRRAARRESVLQQRAATRAPSASQVAEALILLGLAVLDVRVARGQQHPRSTHPLPVRRK